MPDLAPGLSYRAAAARVGCSHTAISDAVKNLRLRTREDGLLDPEAVDYWHRNRRPARGGAHRKVTAKVSSRRAGTSQPNVPPADFGFRFLELADAAPSSHVFGVPAAIADLASTLFAGAWEMAPLLLRHLPKPVAESLLQEWLVAQRREMVGGPGCQFRPNSVEDCWPAPACGGEWADHPIFTVSKDDLTEMWGEAVEKAAAWRAERGLAPL